MRFYAGIGSRKTPQDVREELTRYAEWLRTGGFILRSGHAEGADQAFEEGAGRDCETYLPWYSFRDDVVALGTVRITGADPSLDRFVDKFHPMAETLSSGVRKLMRRNASIILGDKPGESPISLFVLCWTTEGRDSGGTGQAIRMAKAFQVPVINLFHKGADEKLLALLRHLESERDADQGHQQMQHGLQPLHGRVHSRR